LVLNQEVLLHDKISIKTPSGQYQQVDLHMTYKYFYYPTSPSTIRKLKIKWSKIESFYEEVSGLCLFGFSIIKPGHKHDFFTFHESSLERWLSLLSKFCLLTDFEQDFLIIKTIDSGNFGNVSLCQDLVTGAEYAVKCIQKSLIQTATQVSHLKHEIKSMRKVKSPHCVELFRVYEETDSLYLLLELIPQGNLLQRLQKLKKFSEFEVSKLARKLIEAVIHLASVGVVHRDIKLENILLSSFLNNFDVKVADFGLASCSKKPLKDKCGSPGFMAPEVLEGEEYDSKADVFSVGVVCFALLTGKLPFASRQVKDVIDKNQKCEVKFDKQVWKDYSPLALNFVSGLMNKDSAVRPSAEQALAHPWLNKVEGKSESENSNYGLTCEEI
jgi:calcium/calmodulin-dependent protein kinase I